MAILWKEVFLQLLPLPLRLFPLLIATVVMVMEVTIIPNANGIWIWRWMRLDGLRQCLVLGLYLLVFRLLPIMRGVMRMLDFILIRLLLALRKSFILILTILSPHLLLPLLLLLYLILILIPLMSRYTHQCIRVPGPLSMDTLAVPLLWEI